MTEDAFLTLTLPERIKWLHGKDGPRGKLSHDRFGDAIGTSRQVIIAWEKAESYPSPKFQRALAEFSGFTAAAFSVREAEAVVEDSIDRRLRRLEARATRAETSLGRILRALDAAGIELPAARAASRSPATAAQPRRRRKAA